MARKPGIGESLVALGQARNADLTNGYAVRAFVWQTLDEARAQGVNVSFRSELTRWCRAQTEAATDQTAA